MDSPTVALIVGVGTILASGVTSSMVNYYLNKNRTQTIFLREKAEQLYLSSDEFGKSFSVDFLSYSSLFAGKINYDKMLDLQAQGQNTSKYGGVETMTMLVDIYFPSVRPALEDVWKARQEYIEITHDIKAAWLRDGHVKGDWKLKFENASQCINNSIKALQREIVSAARIHAGVKQ